jgi:hypothetical protein
MTRQVAVYELLSTTLPAKIPTPQSNFFFSNLVSQLASSPATHMN